MSKTNLGVRSCISLLHFMNTLLYVKYISIPCDYYLSLHIIPYCCADHTPTYILLLCRSTFKQVSTPSRNSVPYAMSLIKVTINYVLYSNS